MRHGAKFKSAIVATGLAILTCSLSAAPNTKSATLDRLRRLRDILPKHSLQARLNLQRRIIEFLQGSFPEERVAAWRENALLMLQQLKVGQCQEAVAQADTLIFDTKSVGVVEEFPQPNYPELNASLYDREVRTVRSRLIRALICSGDNARAEFEAGVLLQAKSPLWGLTDTEVGAMEQALEELADSQRPHLLRLLQLVSHQEVESF